MHAITESERGALLRVSAALCAIATLLLPMAAQSSSAPTPPDAVASGEFAVPTVAPAMPTPKALSARVRDPFVPIVGDAEPSQTLAPVLVAFASGVRPVALVDVEGRTMAVAVGGSAFGSRVTYVDARTVRLADGRTLALRVRP